MTTAARLLEPIVILCRLAVLVPQMALLPLIRAFFPRLDGSVFMNASSPMRDKAFRQFLCDRTLSGATVANVYDFGGSGQISVDMDSLGRIARAVDVNPASQRPDHLDDVLQIDDGSADLLIACRSLEYFRDDEIAPLLVGMGAAIRPSGSVVVCGPEFSTIPLIDGLLRYLYAVTSPILAGVRLSFRTAHDTKFALERAGFRVEVHHYIARFGLGRSFILFARPDF